jgi:transposase-like protein
MIKRRIRWLSPETEDVVRQLLSSGKGILKVAREAGVGASVVQRVKAEPA